MFRKDYGLGETSVSKIRRIVRNGNEMCWRAQSTCFSLILQGSPELERFSPHTPRRIVTSAEGKQFPVSNTSGCYWKTRRLGMLGGFQTFTLNAVIATEAIRGVFCARRMAKNYRRRESYLVRPRHVSSRKIKKGFRTEILVCIYTENYTEN